MTHRYTVDTEAPIEAVRDALVKHITLRLGHAVYINADESIPAKQPSRGELAWNLLTWVLAIYGFGWSVWFILKHFYG